MTVRQFLDQLFTVGIRLSVIDGKLKVDAPAGVLTAKMKAMLFDHKADLLALLMLKLCGRCGAVMEPIAPGYRSCPACFAQTVEPRSGFWTTTRPNEAANFCANCDQWLADEGECPKCTQATLFAGHCNRCGTYLLPDGSCSLCRQPLPF